MTTVITPQWDQLSKLQCTVSDPYNCTHPVAKVSTSDVTKLDSVRPLVSAPCSELVLIDCNYTRLGDGMSPVGRTEAKPSESMAHMSAMGPVANIHNKEIPLWRLRTARSTTDGLVGVTR